MPGVKALAGTQIGLESSSGTLVAATARWRGPCAFPQDDSPVTSAPEDVAILGGTTRNYIPFKDAIVEFPETEATYEQLPYILSAAVKDVVAGSQDGAGTDYIYAYPMSLTSQNTIKTYTIEGFDNQQEYEGGYGFVESFKLSGKAKEAVKMSAKWRVRQVATSTKTAGLNLVAVSDILFNKGKLYVDAIGGTIGTTQKTATWLGFELNVTTGLMPIPSADGNLYYASHKLGNWEITGKLTIEHDSFATAEYAFFQAGTARLMRMLFEHPTAVGTPGTTYTYKSLIVDLPIIWTKFPRPEAQDGNHIINVEFKSAYDLTAALGPSFKVVNETSTLP